MVAGGLILSRSAGSTAVAGGAISRYRGLRLERIADRFPHLALSLLFPSLGLQLTIEVSFFSLVFVTDPVLMAPVQLLFLGERQSDRLSVCRQEERAPREVVSCRFCGLDTIDRRRQPTSGQVTARDDLRRLLAGQAGRTQPDILGAFNLILRRRRRGRSDVGPRSGLWRAAHADGREL